MGIIKSENDFEKIKLINIPDGKYSRHGKRHELAYKRKHPIERKLGFDRD